MPLTNSDDGVGTEPVWYGIPSRQDFAAPIILKGLREINAQKERSVLWVQHEHGIWRDDHKFATMLKELTIPKVITLHTIHFQSQETSTGLRIRQYNLLQDILPHVEAITVFSRGAFRAVAEAFPQYRDKVNIIRHGIHIYPEICNLTRREAKEKLNDYLIYESDLDLETKEALNREQIFLDPNAILVGQTGFLSQAKNSELLYNIKDNLQILIPNKRVIVVRIGNARDESQKIYAQQLKKMCNQQDKFLLEIWPELSILPLAQRAFDVNFYWPRDCTQSGILAHALGAGTIITGRDLEGVGEMLKEAGEPADTDLSNLLLKIQTIILNPEIGEQIQDKALEYVEEYSWERQAQRHFELAEKIVTPVPSSPVAHSLVNNNAMKMLSVNNVEANVPAEIIGVM